MFQACSLIVALCASYAAAARHGHIFGAADPVTASQPNSPGKPHVFEVRPSTDWADDAATRVRREQKRDDCTDSTLPYGGGPIMGGPIYVNFIWYGSWTPEERRVIVDWARSIGNTSRWNINTVYPGSDPYYPNATHVSDTVIVPADEQAFDAYSRGTQLTDEAIYAVVTDTFERGQVAHYPDTVYFVLTSGDVSVPGFCSDFCGWHTEGVYNHTRVLYSFVGSPQVCMENCAVQAVGPHGPGLGAVDAMISVLTHELEETATNPDVSTGYMDSCGWENSDKCAWTFGSTWTAVNGALANVVLGGREYLIQQNWRLAESKCGMTPNGKPQHDSCQDAIPIDPGFESIYGFNNKLATTSGQPGGSCSFTKDLWYRLDAKSGDRIVVSTCGLTRHDTVVGIYSGCTDTRSTCADDSCDRQSRLARTATTTGTYYIRLGTFPLTAGGAGQFKVQRIASNDECSKATTIVPGRTYAFDTWDAGSSSAFAQPCGRIGRDLWYKYTAAAGQQLVISTCDGLSPSDTVIAAHKGGCSDVALAGCADDSCSGFQSTLAVEADTAGVYYFRLGGWDSSPVNGRFRFDVVSVNDACLKSQYITEGTHSFDTALGRTSTLPACASMGGDLWYRTWAQAGETLRVTTCGLTTADTVVAVYPSCSTGVYERCNDDASPSCGLGPSDVTYVVNRTGSYFIRLGIYQDSNETAAAASGQFRLDRVAPNDECEHAAAVDTDGQAYFDTVAASDSGGPANTCSGASVRRDLWYSVTIPKYAQVTVSTCGDTTANTMLFLQENCSSPSALACNDDAGAPGCTRQSLIRYTSPRTKAYKVRVGSRTASAQGVFTMSLVNDDCPGALPLNTRRGVQRTEYFDTSLATHSLPLCASGCACANKDIWYVTNLLRAGDVFDVSACGTVDYYSAIQVGESCDNVTFCSGDYDGCWGGSRVSFQVPETRRYYVRIGGWMNEIGSGHFTYSVRLSGNLALDFRSPVPGGGFLSLSRPVTTRLTGFTMSAWVYVNSTTPGQVLWYNGVVGTDGAGVVLGANANVQVQVGARTFASGINLRRGRWSFLSVAVFGTRTAWTIYVDGIRRGGVGTTAQRTPTSRFYLGGSAGSYFNGMLDTFQVWSMARSAWQLRGDMNEHTLTGDESGLMMLVNSNQGFGLPTIAGSTAGQLGPFRQQGSFTYAQRR